MRQLVIEGVPINDLSKILQSISEHFLDTAQSVTPQLDGSISESTLNIQVKSLRGKVNIQDIVADVRLALKRNISVSICDGNWNLGVYVLDVELDRFLTNLSMSMAPLDPLMSEKITQATLLALKPESDKGVVILTSKYSRALIFSLFQTEIDNLRVVSTDELCRDVKLNILGTIALQGLPTKEVPVLIEGEVDEASV